MFSERLELGSVAESCRVCVLQDGESRVRLELRAVVDEDSLSTSPGSPPLPPFPSPPILTDTSPVESFLSGKNCLQGVSTSFTSFQVNTPYTQNRNRMFYIFVCYFLRGFSIHLNLFILFNKLFSVHGLLMLFY